MTAGCKDGEQGRPLQTQPTKGRALLGCLGDPRALSPGWLYLLLTTLRPKKWASRRPVAPHTCCKSSPAVACTCGRGGALGAATAGCAQGAHHATPPTPHRPLPNAGLCSGDTRKGLGARGLTRSLPALPVASAAWLAGPSTPTPTPHSAAAPAPRSPPPRPPLPWCCPRPHSCTGGRPAEDAQWGRAPPGAVRLPVHFALSHGRFVTAENFV